MKPRLPTITGIGSVTPYGVQAGLIPTLPIEPSQITAWETDGLRRAFQVQPFQPASIVPGLKTRRLDRLSVWALVAASLALQDADIDLNQVDRTRVAVVFATGFGCIELTEAFYQSASANGWAGTDPITFPETLTNSPAGHVALFHNLQGPNITVSSKHFAAESALLQAASLLRHGQADLAVVIAGDSLTRTMYEWYEVARQLSPTCMSADFLPKASGFIPSEGMVALVVEPENVEATRQRKKPAYAQMLTGRWASGGNPTEPIREMLHGAGLHGAMLQCVFNAGNGAPCDTSSFDVAAAGIVSPETTILPAQPVALGLTDAGALLHLVLALGNRQASRQGSSPDRGSALMVSTSAKSGFAALLFELP